MVRGFLFHKSIIEIIDKVIDNENHYWYYNHVINIDYKL